MQRSQKVIPIFPTATYRIGENFPHNITFLRPTDTSTSQTEKPFFPIDTLLLNKTIVFPICNIYNSYSMCKSIFFCRVSFIYAFGIHIILSFVVRNLYTRYMKSFSSELRKKGITGRMIWH